MRTRLAAAGVAAALLIASEPAWAAAPPPLVVEADHSTAILSKNDDTTHVTYTGHVVITRGTTIIHGAHAVVYITHQHFTKAIVTGSPTHFSRKPKTGRPVHGQANKITYTAADNTVVLEGKAILHRGSEVFHAATASYNLATRVLKAHGQQGGRVHVVLPPAKETHGR
jgi:lipopolysaccharide export system protein LptA